MKKFIRELCAMWVKYQWIKSIERKIRKKEKLYLASKRQGKLLEDLKKMYRERYGEEADND